MTGFAERLIARGAGLPIGLPLLKPRPAARFEQEASTAAETEPPVELARPASSPVSAASPRTSSPPARIEAMVGPSVPDSEVDLETESAAPAPAQPRPPHSAAPPYAETQSHRISGPREVKAAPTTSEPRDMSGGSQAEFRPRPLFFDEPLAKPVTGQAPEVERTPPAPAISIGRIDVQFLPQERPVAPTSPKPQRTRGFDAYARARRGEPR